MTSQSKLRWCCTAFAAAWALLSATLLSHVSHLTDGGARPWLWVAIPMCAAIAANVAARVSPDLAQGRGYLGAAAIASILFSGLVGLTVATFIIAATALSSTLSAFALFAALPAGTAIAFIAFGVAIAFAVPATFSGALVFRGMLWMLKLAGVCRQEEPPTRFT